MARLALLLLGAYQASLDRKPVTGFESDKTRALLAYLAVEADRSHRREKLAALFWPELPEIRAHRNLSQALYNLRAVLKEAAAPAPTLIVQRDALQFNQTSDHWLDVAAFSQLVQACQQHAHQSLPACELCRERLIQAASLYRGDFLLGVCLDCSTAFEEWVLVERERLQRQAMQALHALVEGLEAGGDLERALGYTWQQLELDPLWEPAHRQAMRLLDATGQRSAALLQYETCRRLLAEDLGIPPDADTTRLYERIRSGSEHIDSATSEARPAQPGSPPNNLPAALTPFVGRTASLAALQTRLADPACRLLTLLGPGGCGKTRLALQAAAAQVGRYPDGVWLVPLAALGSTEMLPSAVAAAMDFQFREGEDHQTQLFDYLRPKRSLLILDNFETVLEGATWVSALLRAAPITQVLVTSRARLNIQGEQIFPLGGMGYPKDQKLAEMVGFDPSPYSALQLFRQAAQLSNPHLEWGQTVWQAAARICRLVQGSPLGVLLAASWAGNYAPDEIADEIERSFDFLSADWCDVPERQRSLRATLDYSWRLLSASEQDSLCRLAVFRGGFTHFTASQALQVSPLTLRALLGKSLLERLLDGRYDLHELLRQYAAEKLAASPEVEHAARQGHAELFLGRLPDWAEGIKSARQAAVLAEMEAELGNLGAAWGWAAGQARREVLEAGLESLGLFYDLSTRYLEGELLCRETSQLLAQQAGTDGAFRLRAALLAWQAYFDRQLGQVEPGLRLLVEARTLLEDVDVSAADHSVTRMTAAWIWYVQGRFEEDLERRMEFCQQSLALYRGLGDDWWIARCLDFAGRTAGRRGEYALLLSHSKESLEMRKSLGEPYGIAICLRDVSYAYAFSGEIDLAYQAAQDAALQYRAAGDPASQAEALRHLGTILLIRGSFVEGTDLLEQSLPLQRRLNRQCETMFDLGRAGIGRMHLGDYPTALQHLQDCLEWACSGGWQREQAFALLGLGCVALVQGQAIQAGAKLHESVALFRQLHYAGELGWALGALALAQLSSRDHPEARACLAEGLQITAQTRMFLAASTCLPAAARLLVEMEQPEAALEVYSAAASLPVVGKSNWVEQVAGQMVLSAAAALPAEASAAARKRGQELGPYPAAGRALEIFSKLQEVKRG